MMILNVLTEDLSHQEATIHQYTQGKLEKDIFTIEFRNNNCD